MIIMLIIAVSLMIYALKGTELIVGVGTSAISYSDKRAIKKAKKSGITSDWKQKAKSGVKKTAVVAGKVSTATIKLAVLALKFIRLLLINLLSVTLVIDVIILVLFIAAAAGGFFIISEDGLGSGGAKVIKTTQTGTYDGSIGENDIENEEIKQVLSELMKRWPDDPTIEYRKEFILKGATRAGKSTYAMWDSRRGGSADDQTIFDCSSFVGWTFYKTGYRYIPTWTTTGTYSTGGEVNKYFEKITADELMPGDIGLNLDSVGALGGKNHIVIFVGRREDGTPLYMHCTSTIPCDTMKTVTNGVRISSHSNTVVFFRFKHWGEKGDSVKA